MASIDTELVERLLGQVEAMPAFPKSAERILTLTQDMDASPRALVQAIERDPVVVFKVLRVVNSDYHGSAKRVNSIDRAVAFLGVNTVKNLALGSAAVAMLPSNPMAGFDGQRYLLHSLTTARIGRQLAQHLASTDARDFFMAGLLHDFGKVVLAQFMPAGYREALEHSLWQGVALHISLQEIIGLDHAVIAAALAEKWHLSTHLVDTIRHQHTPEQCDTDMMAGLFAANQISKRLGYDFGGSLVLQPLSPAMAQRLGGELDNVMHSLGDITALLQDAELSSRM